MELIQDNSERGFGRVWRDGRLVVSLVRYSIARSHRVLTTRALGAQSLTPPRDTDRIEGQLLSLFPPHLVGQHVELELEDGRRWKCIVEGGGTLLNSGGISRPSR